MKCNKMWSVTLSLKTINERCISHITNTKPPCVKSSYRGADKSLARPGRKQTTATEEFDVHLSNLVSQLEEY